MVRLRLSIKAELENATKLVPASDHFEYLFQVKCNSCHEVHPKLVSLNRREEYELSGSKGNTAHFVWRCGSCKRESSAKFDPSPSQPYTDENCQFAPLLVIECRGLEFVGFDPQGFWTCVGSTGKGFSEVDLMDGEWTDYDEEVVSFASLIKIATHFMPG